MVFIVFVFEALFVLLVWNLLKAPFKVAHHVKEKKDRERRKKEIDEWFEKYGRRYY